MAAVISMTHKSCTESKVKEMKGPTRVICRPLRHRITHHSISKIACKRRVLLIMSRRLRHVRLFHSTNVDGGLIMRHFFFIVRCNHRTPLSRRRYAEFDATCSFLSLSNPTKLLHTKSLVITLYTNVLCIRLGHIFFP